jgi:hypothetical protein
MTQHRAIRKYIDDFGSITPLEAIADLGITKLATRISEMRKRGEKFHIEMIPTVTRYGKKTRYAKYSKEAL